MRDERLLMLAEKPDNVDGELIRDRVVVSVLLDSNVGFQDLAHSLSDACNGHFF